MEVDQAVDNIINRIKKKKSKPTKAEVDNIINRIKKKKSKPTKAEEIEDLAIRNRKRRELEDKVEDKVKTDFSKLIEPSLEDMFKEAHKKRTLRRPAIFGKEYRKRKIGEKLINDAWLKTHINDAMRYGFYTPEQQAKGRNA